MLRGRLVYITIASVSSSGAKRSQRIFVIASEATHSMISPRLSLAYSPHSYALDFEKLFRFRTTTRRYSKRSTRQKDTKIAGRIQYKRRQSGLSSLASFCAYIPVCCFDDLALGTMQSLNRYSHHLIVVRPNVISFPDSGHISRLCRLCASCDRQRAACTKDETRSVDPIQWNSLRMDRMRRFACRTHQDGRRKSHKGSSRQSEAFIPSCSRRTPR